MRSEGTAASLKSEWEAKGSTSYDRGSSEVGGKGGVPEVGVGGK